MEWGSAHQKTVTQSSGGLLSIALFCGNCLASGKHYSEQSDADLHGSFVQSSHKNRESVKNRVPNAFSHNFANFKAKPLRFVVRILVYPRI
jgi:hypothetical protein